MNTLEARRRLLGRNVYKRTTEGNPAIAQGSLARMYPGITMQGWTEQAQYEGKNLFDGIFTVDTVLDLNGETVPYPGRSTTDFIKVKQSTDYTGFTQYLRACYYDAGKVIISYDDDTVTRQTPEGCEYVRFCFINGSNVMFNEGSIALPYEPYTGGQPSPSPEYPQKITSAGKYNEDTQKWEYEITITNAQTDPDKNQTVTLTADRQLTKWDKLEKRGGQWGWVYKSAEIVLDGSEQWKTIENGFYIANGIEDTVKYDKNMLIDKLIYASSGEYPRFIVIPSGEAYTPSIFNVADSVNGMKEWLASNPLTVWYETESETFVPLSESEQEAMNAIYTFRPTTVLSNDCGCEMTLTYKTKKSLEVTD